MAAVVVTVAWLVSGTLLGATHAHAAGPVEPGTEIDRLPTKEKVVALTFDDAWDDASLESILDTLQGAGVKATFFPTGAGVESSPELARRIAAEGHELGSHSYEHVKVEALSGDELVSQIQMTEDVFATAGLSDPSPVFRAPWGEVNRQVLAVLGEEGYVHVLWTARGGDNVAHRSAAQVIAYIMEDVRPGAIIVMHTNNDVTPKALPELIRRLKAKGYGFVTLGEGLLSAEQRMARYQQTSPLLGYLGEWQTAVSALESGGSLSHTDIAGAAVLAAFTGSTLELIARTGPDCGKVQVTIDGGVSQEVDLYSPTEQHRATVFSRSDLEEKPHFALVRCLGKKDPASTGRLVDIDAVKVAGRLTQAPPPQVYLLGRLFALVLGY